MSRIQVAAVATAALLATTTMVEAAPFEFRGFYAGAHAGYTDSEADFASGGNLDDKGSMGGLQVGYNFLNGNFLYGIEFDVSLTGTKPSGTCPDSLANSCEIDSGPMATLRARLGYAQDDWLIYVTGGAAGSRFELDVDGDSTGTAGLHGWTVGAGAEYLLGDIVGVKLEYRYLQFGDFGGFEAELEGPSGTDIDVNMHVIMGGINFHF